MNAADFAHALDVIAAAYPGDVPNDPTLRYDVVAFDAGRVVVLEF